MAGRSGVIGEIVNVSVGGDINCGPGVGSASWRRAQFFLDTTAITPAGGSFDVSVRYETADGTNLVIATLAAVNSLGILAFTLDGNFSAVEDIVPEPVKMFLTRNGSAVDFSAKLYMFAG